MDPKSATEKAMEEVGGPVVAIALILAAVFIPYGGDSRHHRAHVSAVRRHHRDLCFDLGVQRVNSVAGPCGASSETQQEGRKKGLLTKASDSFNKFFGRTTDGFVGFSRVLIHKSSFAMLGSFCLRS
jgi:HAE1 family hydrophobic/amphiphilic exporter-1